MSRTVILTEEDICHITHQKNSLTRMVYEELIRRFINGELVPGEFINRRLIAVELGVSVAPVLEALVQLELEGFLESVPRKGTIVSPVKEKDALAQLLIRESFECTAVRIYCGKLVRDNYKEFKEYATWMDEVDNQGGGMSLAFKRAEINLHASLVNLCGMPIFTREFIRSIRVGVFSNINRVNRVVTKRQSHSDLVDRLTTDDKDAAVAAVRSHLWSGKPLLSEVYQKSIEGLMK